MSTTTEPKSKEERREEILDAAIAEFAQKGLHGASTEEIARAGYRTRGRRPLRAVIRAVIVSCFVSAFGPYANRSTA